MTTASTPGKPPSPSSPACPRRAGTAVTVTATTALAAASFSQAPRFVRLGGLFQRASIITGFAWLASLSARALQHAPGRNPGSGVGSGRRRS